MTEVKFVCITREDHIVKIVVEVWFVNTTSKDHIVKIVIPLDTLLGSYEAVSMLP